MPFMSHSSAPTTRFGGFGLTYGHFGYLPGLATDGSDVGALSDTKFACQGVTYTVGELYSGSAADNVNNRMTLFINPAGDAVFNNNVSATLLNGGTAFSFGDDPFNPSAEEYRCKTSGLTLSVGDTITVSPRNATGTPDISGTAQFGWTLTARPGTIQDQDGLSGTYTHQWIWVDNGQETKIHGGPHATTCSPPPTKTRRSRCGSGTPTTRAT